MKKNYQINYEYTGYSNELKSITIGNIEYGLPLLSFEVKELLTVMTYEDYQDTIEYFTGIAQMIGYDVTTQAIKDLEELGVQIASKSIYRKLVIDGAKAKYKGMWR